VKTATLALHAAILVAGTVMLVQAFLWIVGVIHAPAITESQKAAVATTRPGQCITYVKGEIIRIDDEDMTVVAASPGRIVVSRPPTKARPHRKDAVLLCLPIRRSATRSSWPVYRRRTALVSRP
jgi:hypothetical protein